MDHTFLTDTAPAPDSRAATLPPPRQTGRHRPLGWRCLEVTAIGGPPDARLRVNAVLLHPQHGIALIDLAPRSTPRAAEALRLTLGAWGVRSWPANDIPIAYLCLAPEEMRNLPDLLRAAIEQRAAAPASPDRTWMAEVAAALDSLERSDRARTGTLAEAKSGAGRSRWLLPGLLAISLGAGIAGGMLIPHRPAPMTAGDGRPGAALTQPDGAVRPEAGAASAVPVPPAASGSLGPVVTPMGVQPAPARPAGAGAANGLPAVPPAPPPAGLAAPPRPSSSPASPPSSVAATADPAASRAQPRAETASNLARRPAPSAAGPARAPASPLCAPLLARLQLGERPTDADQALLRTACAPS